MNYWQRRRLFLLLLGAPAVLYVLLVAVWPLAEGIALSLYDYNLQRPARIRFVGGDNYLDFFRSDTGLRTLANTFGFTVLAVGIEFVFGFALALLLWRDSLFNRVSLALLLIPVSITPLAVGLVFKALLSADFGWLGYHAIQAGLVGERGFFGHPIAAAAAILLIDAWQWTPLMALILLAGLKTLPNELLEAAQVDGASALQRLFHVVWPLMLPSIFLALTLRSMDAFRIFDAIYVTTKGGPDDATEVMQLLAVKQGLEFFNVGYASAIANIMLVAIALMALGFTLLLRRSTARARL